MSTIDEKKASARARATYHPTRHRGLSYQARADGSKAFFGYVQGRGRVKLEAAGERDAVAEYGDLRGRVAKGEKIAPASVKLGAVAEQWIEDKNGSLREWTRRGYRASLDNEILPRFEHRRLKEISYDDVVKWVRTLEARGLSTSTVTSHLKVLSGIFKYARKRGLVSQNPVDLVDSSDRGARRERETDHVWSEKEIEALIASSEYLARKRESRYDYSPLIRTAISTGLRLGELLGLTWADIDGDVLHVRRQWSRLGEYTEPKTKAGKRRVPLSKDMVALFRKLKEEAFAKGFAGPEYPVFASKTGTPLTHRNAQGRAFAAAAELAELEGVTFHSMRHAFASRMIAGGINPVQLAHVMGHENATITLTRYASLYDREGTDEAIRQAMAR